MLPPVRGPLLLYVCQEHFLNLINGQQSEQSAQLGKAACRDVEHRVGVKIYLRKLKQQDPSSRASQEHHPNEALLARLSTFDDFG